jgi:hypothetical protein
VSCASFARITRTFGDTSPRGYAQPIPHSP